MPELDCRWCGETFNRPKSRVGKGFCSESCGAKHRWAQGPAKYHFRPFDGKPYKWPYWNVESTNIFVHQLLAIHKGHDPREVFGRGGKTVHHKNGCHFDDRPNNIELMDLKKHASHDGKKGDSNHLYTHKDMLQVISFMMNPL